MRRRGTASARAPSISRCSESTGVRRLARISTTSMAVQVPNAIRSVSTGLGPVWALPSTWISGPPGRLAMKRCSPSHFTAAWLTSPIAKFGSVSMSLTVWSPG